VADFLDKNLFGNGIPCLSGPSNRKTIVGFFHPRLTNLDKLKSFVFPLDSLSVDDSNSNGYSEVDDTFGPKITFSEVFARTQCFFFLHNSPPFAFHGNIRVLWRYIGIVCFYRIKWDPMDAINTIWFIRG